MIPIRVKEVVEATCGRLLCGDETAEITKVITDSREAGEGALFVPIIGERVDAHRFISDVLTAGAAAVFTSKERKEDGTLFSDGTCILVDDTLDALQKFAAWYREQFDIPVIGITGSVGKTTTKEMVSTVLSTRYNVLKTIGNLNSQIGVALMMFHIDKDTELAVFEMGMSMPGEMEKLVEIAKPQTAVMTNIGVSHIGNLKTRDNIAFEKGHIVKYVGTAFEGQMYICGNGDLQMLTKKNIPYELGQEDCQTIFYGTEPGCSIMATDVQVTADGQKFIYHGENTVTASLSVMGGHNVSNAVIALAIGEQFGVDMKDALLALKEYRPFSMRGERKDCHGYHVIDDTYNASPDSINSNIDALFDYDASGNKIAVLGDVLELGEQMETLHRGIGDYIIEEAKKGKKLACVITVGEGGLFITKQLQKHSDIKTKHCDNNEEAAHYVKQIASQGDWILVKGSRGMHMDEVVKKVVM